MKAGKFEFEYEEEGLSSSTQQHDSISALVALITCQVMLLLMVAA